MHSQSYKRPVGDQYEIEVLEIFGEGYSAEIYVAIYETYALEIPPEVAQGLIAFEQRMRADHYEDYLTDYYSSLEDEYEKEMASPNV